MSSVLDYLVLGLYFAAMLGAGYWGLRRAGSTEDYLVAGRRLGPALYIGTLSAGVLGGASTIGSVSLGYEFGVSGMWLVFMIGLGIVALDLLLSTRLSRLGVYTVSEMLSIRYGSSSRLISAIIVATYALMIAVTSTIAVGSVFGVVLGLPPLLVGVVLVVAVIVSDVVGALTVAYDLLVGVLFVPIIGADVLEARDGGGGAGLEARRRRGRGGAHGPAGTSRQQPDLWRAVGGPRDLRVVSLLTPRGSEDEALAWGQRMTGQGTT